MKLNRFYIYLAISVVILAGLVIRDYNPGGRLEIITDFSQSSSYITTLNPPGNVNKGFVAKMPVTFKVHLPNFYDQVELFFQTEGAHDLKIGIVTSADPEMVALTDGLDITLPKQTELKFQLDSAEAEPKPVTIQEMKLVFTRNGHNLADYLSIWKQSIGKIF